LKRLLFMAMVVLAACTKDGADAAKTLSGSWAVTETQTRTGSKASYAIQIEEGSATGQFKAGNFFNLGVNNRALITLSSTSLQMDRQPVSGYMLSGTGTYDGADSFTMRFSAEDGSGSSEAYTLQATRQ
jgi:hypothetical protein